MERPTVLLAVEGVADHYLEGLERAGFASIQPSGDAIPAGSFDLAVIDCDLGSDVAAAIYASVEAQGNVPVLLMLGETMDIPQGFGAATNELAMKPLAADALVYRLQALLIRGGQHLPSESSAWTSSEGLTSAPVAGEGRAVSVFAPKGGVGKTTIAVNIAVALRQQTRSDVLLLDADVGVGNVTSVLEVPYRMGLADLADSPPEEWTDAAFDQCVAIHADTGLRVLTWGTDPAESERVTVDLLLAALRWARNHHSYVIIDNHPGYDDRTMAMLAVADEILLVVTPEVGALRNSAQFLDLARNLGLANMIRVVVNRANHGIRVEDMSKSLGLPISATVVSSGPKAVIASNEGKPVITKFPKERIADDLYAVARLISNPEGEAKPAATQGRSWWARFGVRTSNA
ncbi:MAG: AAA family ATPase [Candidatus Limnocylindria bacterium]